MNQAVTMLIERMSTNPEDFFGNVGHDESRIGIRAFNKQNVPKLRHVAVQIERHIIGALGRDESTGDAYWFLTEEEREALRVAYTKAKRTRFIADTIYTILNKNEPEDDGPQAYAVPVTAISSTAGFSSNLLRSESNTASNHITSSGIGAQP